MILVAISTLAFLAGVIVTYWLHSEHNMDVVVEPVELPPALQTPLISVIVPARNEERNIKRCVEALLAQTYPKFELIVVDDNSGDATLRILKEIQNTNLGEPQADGQTRLQVVQGKFLPEGWAGKPHALMQGSRQAQGEWLSFVDGDTFATPHLLASTYTRALQKRADLFTILTDQELGSFWEKVVLPLVFTALSVGFPARRVNDPHKKDAIANGQFILIRRNVYDTIGGHTAVKDRIDEDKALAEVVKGSGFRLVVADGRKLARTRMYTNLVDMWEGWTKNIFLGMRDRLGLLFVGVILGLVAALALPFWLVGGVAWYSATREATAAIVAVQALLLWLYLLYKRVQATQAYRISPAYALTLPLGALVFTAMMFASAFKVLSRQGVAWRGRVYKS